MAKFVLTDAFILVNGVDLSNLCASVEVKMGRDDVETTTMSATGKGRLPGLRDEGFQVTWLQDFAASKVDATLSPLYINGTSFTVEVRPTSAARSVTNPGFTGTCFLNDYTPVGGQVGNRAESKSAFVVDGVISRQTA